MKISGRKYATMVIVSTYCVMAVGSLALAALKIMSLNTFLAMVSGLGSITMYIIKAYFDDKTRDKGGKQQ